MTTVIEFYVPEKDRKKALKLFLEEFEKEDSKQIESGCYKFAKQFCHGNQSNILLAKSIYNDRVHDILYNCNSKNTTMTKIKKKIKRGKFSAYNLAFLRPNEINEDNWMKIVLRMKTTSEVLSNLPAIEWEPCIQCGCTEHYLYHLETRNADELPTTYTICETCTKITCIECKCAEYYSYQLQTKSADELPTTYIIYV
jgi:DNA-directed RNA polymerase subunit M/transcription elongation factor TFIIS